MAPHFSVRKKKSQSSHWFAVLPWSVPGLPLGALLYHPPLLIWLHSLLPLCDFLNVPKLASALEVEAFSSPWNVHSPYTFMTHSVFFTHKSSSDQCVQNCTSPRPQKNYTPTLHHSIPFLPCFTFPSSTFHFVYCILYIIIYCLLYSGLNLPIRNVNSIRVRFWSVFVFFHSGEQSWAQNHHKKNFF